MTAKILGRNQTIHRVGSETLLYEFWYKTPDFDDLDNYDPDHDDSGLYVKDVKNNLVLGHIYRFDGQFWIDSLYCPYFRAVGIETVRIGITERSHHYPIGWESMQECLSHFLATYMAGTKVPVAVD